MVTSLDPLEATEYIEAFKKDTGIDVHWIRLSAGEALARLKTEMVNPTQDIWFGAPATEFAAAKDAGLLEPYISNATKNIPAKWRDKEGYWTGIYFGAIIFISSKDIDEPKSWKDLLDPKYKNEIVVSYPYTAGTGYAVLSGLVAFMGEDATLSYYKSLDPQIRRYTKSGGAPVMEVGLGEARVGIVFDQDARRKGKARGFDFNITYPSDGLPYEIGSVAIVRGGNKESSAKFIDWITTRGQGLMPKWYRTPLNPEPPELKKLKLAPVNLDEAGAMRGELIKKWREKVQR